MNSMFSRRDFFSIGVALAAPSMARAALSVIAGAIRWDAWQATGSDVLTSVEATLNPSEYQRRAPFCATLSATNDIRFVRCNMQATMDAEITYAAAAGLSYWAYCWYGASDPLMNAWKLHQASNRRHLLNWCLLLQFSRLGNAAEFEALTSTYVRYFRQENYQKLMGGRPLLYVYVDDPAYLASRWGGDWANLGSALDGLRNSCAQAAVSPPYIVIMTGGPAAAHNIMSQVRGDAISNYMARVPNGEPAPYEALDSSAQAYWVSLAATGSPIVPICMTGWDTRPRKRRPPPWDKGQLPGVGMTKYVVAGTPAQIAAHVQAAVTYISANPISCPSRSLLIYSWDECDEGGSALIPTYTPSGPNHAILDAVAGVLGRH